jgi:hypothetical protein
VFVVELGGTGVRYIRLTENGGFDACVASLKQVITETALLINLFSGLLPMSLMIGNQLNHGIDLSVNGKTLLYVVDDDNLQLPMGCCFWDLIKHEDAHNRRTGLRINWKATSGIPTRHKQR